MVQPIEDARRRTGAAASSRVPPHDLDAEASLLGAMLLSRDAIAAAIEIVSSDDFYKPAHTHVFDAIGTLYAEGEAVDPVTVADELRRAGVLDAVGGAAALIELQASTPATTNAARYARIVEEHALLRRLIAVAAEIAELGYDLPEDVASAVDRAESLVFEIAERRVTDTLAPIRDLLSHNLDRLEALYERGDAVTGLPTGYADLDDLLAGLQPSGLVVVGARPAMGKCVTGDTLVPDPATGDLRPIAELGSRVGGGDDLEVLAADGDGALSPARVGAFVADGVRPVYRVRTRLGRELRATGSHPLLTPGGWRPVAALSAGDRVAVPRRLPVFGDAPVPAHEVALLAYLVSADATGVGPRLRTASATVAADLDAHAERLGARLRSRPVGAGAVHHVLDGPTADGAGGASALDAPGSANPAAANPAAANPAAANPAAANPAAALARAHGLDDPPDRRALPPVVFRLGRPRLALFLNRLFAGAPAQGGPHTLRTPSAEVARGTQHLLSRFGVCAAVRRRVVGDGGARYPGFEVAVCAGDLDAFAAQIGVLGRDEALFELADVLAGAPAATADGGEVDVPVPDVAAAAAVGAGAPATVGVPAPPRVAAPPRAVAAGDVAATATGDVPAGFSSGSGAQGDLAWDTVADVVPAGEAPVYDLAVPGPATFVAGDMVVHNTSLALGAATHASLEQHRPVLFFSLEMSHLELTQRILCAEAKVDSSRMRNGRLTEGDWTRISHAVGRLAEAPIYIDDNPNLTVMEIRAKARRLKSRLGDLGLVVVDYLQLMAGRTSAENRQVEVAEISRGLKILARELETPVVALSQLSRNLEQRTDKRPMLADLRESGCLTADTRIRRADTGAEVTLGELVADGGGDVPVWSVDGQGRLVPGRVTAAFPSGVKPVFGLRLSSGLEVTASGNHPFLTTSGWRPLADLRVGDRVAAPAHLPAPTRPRSWPDDQVVLLAHLLGTGTVAADDPLAYRSPLAEAHEAVDKAARAFGLVPRVAAEAGEWTTHLGAPIALDAGEHPVLAWLDELGLAGLAEAELAVPPEVHGLEDRQVALFLHHLWLAGGEVARAGGGVAVSFTCRSRRLADDVRALLLRLGVASRLGPSRGEAFAPRYRLWVDEAPSQRRFVAAVGVPGAPPGATEALLDALGDPPERGAPGGDTRFEEIIAIEPRGAVPVFDATVEGTHSFLADGIVVHNSIEQDADVVVFIYRDEIYNPDSPDRGTAEVIVAKHRNGPTGTVRLAFLDHVTRFANMAKGV